MTFEEQASSLTQAEIVKLLATKEVLASENSNLHIRNSSLQKSFSELLERNSQQEAEISEKEAEISKLQLELEWFRKQIFGERSERRVLEADSRQLCLGELLNETSQVPEPLETVNSFQRKRRSKEPLEGSPLDSGLRFDPKKIPVEEIEIPNPVTEGLSEEDYKVVSEKTTYRLAQRPGSYVVLKYVRKTVKLNEADELITPPAPPAVIEGSYSDVSFLVGLLIDKYLYHIPLHRQYKRLEASGIKLSRATLTNLVRHTATLLEPLYHALLSSILVSQVLTMDETPIKAGRKAKGKLQTGYFWPIFGESEEIVFLFSPSRAGKIVRETLGEFCGVLVTDGYKVYERFADASNAVIHAQCWSHARRKFVEIENKEPELVRTALAYIQQLYNIEQDIREKRLEDDTCLRRRIEHSRPVVNEYFSWLRSVFDKQVLLPSNPFTKAAHYSLKREDALRVFLSQPSVPIDTNHIEREIRPVAVGRKNYMFCWTEVGARDSAIIYSLIASCRLQEINPYDYLVDVLQRIDTHPAREVDLLIPRNWKTHFQDKKLVSDVSNILENKEQ